MINFKHSFFDGVNADDDPRFVGRDEALNLENIRGNVSGMSQNFQLKNIPSTELLDYYRPPGTNKIVGRVMDYNRGRLIMFNKNSGGEDGIYAYDVAEQFTYTVLFSSQVEGGLNFSLNRDYRIARNAKVVSDLLMWTDDLNEPKCISIEAGIKTNHPSYITEVEPYSVPIPYTYNTIIRRPPLYALQVSKITDIGFDNNYIANYAYQFYYRYWDKDLFYSVLSTFSQLIPLNGIDETYNAINIKMPFTEEIPDMVQQVDFCVRYGNFGDSFVIKSYNKNNYYDELAIQMHNENTVQLGFTFYDNFAGIPIDTLTANTSFDNVALLAKTIDMARNRAFLANLLKGYDSPDRSSLTLELGYYNTDGAGIYLSDWKYLFVTYVDTTTGITGQVAYHYAYNGTLNPAVYFYDAYKDFPSPLPSLNTDEATTAQPTENDLALFIQRNYSPPVGTIWIYAPIGTYDTGYDLDLVFTINLDGLQFFKSAGNYQVSVTFYDRYRRKCGVCTDYVEINIPERIFSQSVFATNIVWSLNNSNTLVEIPIWAYYYGINITKNLQTRFFIQIKVTTSFYSVKPFDEYENDQTIYVNNITVAVAFDITPLISNGIGYVFTEGDYVRVSKDDDTNVLLRIIAQSGNFILATPTDFGTLGADVQDFVIELFTPYRPSLIEPFYETGDMIPINNPATDQREYSLLSNTINGDCYAIQRNSGTDFLTEFYFVEAMSPNDKVWQVWQQDRGWVNYIDSIGQQRKETSFDWSDTYINGTKINGLNKYQVANTRDIGNSTGEIEKLQLTNKQQEDGTVMLIVSKNSHFSAYLGERQLVASAINDALVQVDEVIGTINELKNGVGTTNPESIVEWKGVVWGISVINGCVWQYANNGVTRVSDFKLKRYMDRFSKRYLELGTEAIEALCSFSYIDSAVDPSSEEVLFTLPQTEVNTITSGIPVGFSPALPSYSTLPDYASSIQNRFDFYDGQPKTIVYKYMRNKWFGAYEWLPDLMENYGNKFFGCKDGELWLFNESLTSWNNIFNVEYPQRICFSCNIEPSIPKDILDIAIEGNAQTPNYTVVYTLLPNEQITDLVESDYVNKEGVMYASFFRDRLSPNTAGSVVTKMYYGDDMKSIAALVMLEFSVYDSELINNFVDVGLELSRGHIQIMLNKNQNY